MWLFLITNLKKIRLQANVSCLLVTLHFAGSSSIFALNKVLMLIFDNRTLLAFVAGMLEKNDPSQAKKNTIKITLRRMHLLPPSPGYRVPHF